MEEKRQEQEKKQEQERAGRADNTLFELSVGIVCWAILCQAVGIWFVQNKSSYSIGLWLGALVAVVSGIHMWWGFNKALDFSQDTAVKMITKYNIFRYFIIVASFALIMCSKFANPLAAFLALIGLKIAAYIQPFTHKICTIFYKK